MVGLDDDIPAGARGGRKNLKFKKNNNENIVSLDEDDEEKINLDDDTDITTPKMRGKKRRNNFLEIEDIEELPSNKYGEHYHKGKDGMIFKYVFSNLLNSNTIEYACSEKDCKSRAILKIKEQDFAILTEHSNYYLHKGLMNSIMNDKNFKLMNRKGYKDIQFNK